MKISDIIWTNVFAVLLALACVVCGILGTGMNIWLPLGLASITSALLTPRINR